MTRHRIPVTLTLAPEVLETLRRRAAESRLSLSVLVERIAVGLEPPVAASGDQTAAAQEAEQTRARLKESERRVAERLRRRFTG